MKKPIVALIVLILSLSVTCIAFANVFTGGFPSNDVKSLKYVISGGDSNYQQNIMKAGCNAWNGISSKVAVSNNNSGAKVSVYKSTTNTSGLWGEARPYYKKYGIWIYDSACVNIWGIADVYGYDNQMSNSNLLNSEKKAVFTHEMGHILSLAHISSDGVMVSGRNKSLTPTTTDKNNLKLKWGN